MAYNSLCWTCAKCTSIYKCKWSFFCYSLGLNASNFALNKTANEILKHVPKGVKLDKYNNIISCPEYKFDGLLIGEEKLKKQAKELGVSIGILRKKLRVFKRLGKNNGE